MCEPGESRYFAADSPISRDCYTHGHRGASAWDVFRQLLTESLVVALAGGVLGLGIAAVGSKLLIAYAARMTPLSGEIHLDDRVLFFVAALSDVAGVLFGALPGFVASGDRLSVLTGSGERSVGSGQITRTP